MAKNGKNKRWRALRAARRAWARELERRRRAHGGVAVQSYRHSGRSLPLLDFLRDRWRPQFNGRFDQDTGTAFISIPQLFSFIRNPEESVDVLRSVLAVGGSASTVYLDYSDCADMDLCASLALGIIAREFKREWNVQKVTRRFAGKWSKTAHVKEVMRCTGIIKHLRITSPEASATPEESKKYEILDIIHGFRSSQSSGSSTQEQAAQKLTEYFIRCFARMQLRLSGLAEADMMELIGEVMDNAERHSGRNEWFAQAYFDQSQGASWGICHVAIVSFGTTIAESLRLAENSAETRARINELVEAHKRGGWFGVREPLTEESLLTFYALQDGVSCTNKPGAGSGTVKLIEHFLQLSRIDSENVGPLMTVISGSTQILFDHEHHMHDVGGRKVITFNASRTLDEPPSANHVRRLRFSFPGTLIALRFQMERAFLQQLQALFNDAD